MQHLEEGTIHAWLDGVLSGDEQAQVEQHVQQCAECAGMVAEARGMIAGAARIVSALDVVPGGVIPKQRTAAPGSGSLWRSLRLTPFRAALAAGLMIAAASVVAVRHDAARPFDAMRADSVVSPMTASAPAPAPAPAVVAPAAPVAAAAGRRVTSAEASAVANATKPFAGSFAKAPAARQALSDVAGADAALKKVDSSGALPRMVAAAPLPTLPAAPVVGAMNEARRSVQDTQRDSAVADAAKAKTRSTVGELRAQAQGGGMSAARQLIMTNRESVDVAGCYQGSRDSVGGPSLLPERFALERSGSPPARNAIYAIDAAGRLDTTVVGTWRSLGTNAITMNLIVGTARESITLAQTVGGLMVQPVTSFAPGRPPLRIVRVDCPR